MGRSAHAGSVLRLFLVAGILFALLGPVLTPNPAYAEESMVTFRDHYFGDVPASQAYYLDVAGTTGLIRGDSGLGGPARPSEPVTRAEFAVMVYRLLELDPAFAGPSSDSLPFRDASSVPEWAVEAVAACWSLGIITGEPDGRGGYYFNPDDVVNGAETVAMLLRALDNDEAVTGGWPAGYIYRAFETGLFATDLTAGDWRLIQPLSPISRAQMAYLLSNALFCSRGYVFVAAGGMKDYAQSSIGGRLTGYALVIGANLLTRSLTTSEGRTLNLGAYVVAGEVRRSADLIGRRIFWIENTRGQVALIRRYAQEAAVTGSLDRLELSQDSARLAAVHLEDGRVIRCGPETIVELNGQRWPFYPGNVLPVASVSAIMEGGLAAHVSIVQEDLPEAVIIGLSFDPQASGGSAGSSGPTTGRVTARISMGQGDIPLDVTPDTAVYLNGQPADLSELREWDVFYAATEGSVPKRALDLYAYRRQVTGTVRAAARSFDAKNFHWELVIEDRQGVESTLRFSPFCEDLVGLALLDREFTFCLGREDLVTFFRGPAPTPGTARVAKALRTVAVHGHRLLTVDWMGAELTYDLGTSAAAPEDGTLFRMTLDRQGAVSQTAAVQPALFEATVTGTDPLRGRLSLKREERMWTLDVRYVPGYSVADLGDQDKPGTAVLLEDLAPGGSVWLEDPGSPGYYLVVGP